MSENRIIFKIKPQTHIRTTEGDSILFRIPMVCSSDDGGPCKDYKKNEPLNHFQEFKNKKKKIHIGYCVHTLSEGGRKRKKLIERYNQYKIDLRELSHKSGFVLYPCGWSVYFYLPLPKRSNGFPDGDRAKMHGQLKLTTPDVDNFFKSLSDSLWITDEMVAQLSGIGKFWIDPDQVSEELKNGYIEILLNQPIYNPFNVQFIDQQRLKRQIKNKPRRKYAKRKAK